MKYNILVSNILTNKMFWNIFVASTNIFGLLPIYTSFVNNDYITSLIILVLVVVSFLSHLIENHTHDMEGIGLSNNVSYIFNMIDILMYVVTLIRFLFLCPLHNFTVNYRTLAVLLPLIIINFVSEYDKYNRELKYLYIYIHSLWHIGIYITMHNILLISY